LAGKKSQRQNDDMIDAIWVSGEKGEPAKIVLVLGNGLKVETQIDKATQSQADLHAIIHAFELIKAEPRKCIIYTDSNIIHGQLIKKWPIRQNMHLSLQALNLFKMLESIIQIRLVRKEQNRARQ